MEKTLNDPSFLPWSLRSKAANPDMAMLYLVIHDCQGEFASAAEKQAQPSMSTIFVK